MPRASSSPDPAPAGLSGLPCPGLTLRWNDERVTIPRQMLLHPTHEPEWPPSGENNEAGKLLSAWISHEADLRRRVERRLRGQLCAGDGSLIMGATGELRDICAAASEEAKTALDAVRGRIPEAVSMASAAETGEVPAALALAHSLVIREAVKTFLAAKSLHDTARKLMTHALLKHVEGYAPADSRPQRTALPTPDGLDKGHVPDIGFDLEDSKGVHENILIAFALLEKNAAAPGKEGPWQQIQELKHAMGQVKSGDTYKQVRNVLSRDFGYTSGFASLRSALSRFVRWFAAQGLGGEPEIYRILRYYKVLDPNVKRSLDALLRP